MVPVSNAPVPDAVVSGFAERVATRDMPPPLPPDFFGSEAVQARIGAALRERLPHSVRVQRRQNLARVLYALMQAPALDLYEVMAAAGTERQAASEHLHLLGEAGLLERAPAGRRLRYALSRAGEDWLLAAVDPHGLARPAEAAPS